MPKAWQCGTATVGDRSREVWKPHVTVAAVCERDSRFLLVRERAHGRIVLNQPAGHLEPDETLEQAVIRETLEETAYDFTPTGLLGIYRCIAAENAETYLRFAFAGRLGQQHKQALDQGILAAEWLTLDEIKREQASLRTPMVMQCILDYLDQRPYPLQVFSPDFA
jgi:ADP-ribose pyrophosphatase YjhB (NUDIX family)